MGSKNHMANYLRRSKNVAAGGRSKGNEGYCKRHPKHRQSPGVCSLCLGEKLSQLSAYSSSRSTTTRVASSCSSSSSLSSDYSSSSATSCSPPMHRYRFATEGKSTSLSFLFFSGKNILTKSRSVAFASRMRGKEGNDEKKKKDGFLSKLLHPRRTNKRKEEAAGLVHSRTMREIMTIRVH